MDLRVVFMLFIIYSFLGWIVDTIGAGLKEKKLVPRGFLIGPYCPIYGFGALLIIFFLSKYQNDLLALFVLACIFGASLEYFTSYIMEKMFNARWWDYSYTKYNLNGRVCVRTTVAFGLLGVVLVKYLNPFFENLIVNMPDLLLSILSIGILVLFITDVAVSFNIISNIKKVDLSGAADSTEEITKRVKETLRSKSILNKRLVLAFPRLKVKLPKISLDKLKEDIINRTKNV